MPFHQVHERMNREGIATRGLNHRIACQIPFPFADLKLIRRPSRCHSQRGGLDFDECGAFYQEIHRDRRRREERAQAKYRPADNFPMVVAHVRKTGSGYSVEPEVRSSSIDRSCDS